MKKIGKAIAKKFKNWKGTTTADMENSDTPADVEEVKVEIKKQTNTVDKATETDTQLCNKNSETGQPIFESSEKAQNAPTETPNASNYFFSSEIKSYDVAEEKFIILQKS